MSPPRGWSEAALGDVCTIVSGATPKTSVAENWGGGINWITPNDLSKDRSQVVHEGERSLSPSGYDSCSARLFPAGSVVVSSRAPVGYVAIAGSEMCTNQGCKTAVPPDDIDSRYLYWYLVAAKQDLESRASGTTFKEISAKRFAETIIHWPDLDEQRHIVDRLDDHLSRLDAATSQLELVSNRSAVLVRSALQRGLRGDLVLDDLSDGSGHDLLLGAPGFEPAERDRVWDIPDAWAWSRIGDLFDVNVGTTPPRSSGALWSGGLPWVSSGEVSFGRIASTREQITRQAAGNPARRIHPPGTVMLAMIGEGKTRGQAAILDIEAAHNQNCASIRVSSTDVLPEYIYGYLEERYLETRRGGAGGQQPALNKTAIQRFAVPIAPLATQRRLVDAWDRVRQSSDRLKQESARAVVHASAVRRSLLTAAFSGRLTGHAEDLDRIEEAMG